MATLVLVFLTAFIVVLYSTPALIKVAVLKRLIDVPTEDRKIHKRSVPTIGGIIIYAGTLFAFALWYSIDDMLYYDKIFQSVKEFKLIVACSLILFFVGVKDDIIGTAPVKKLFAHIVVALILVLMGDIRITRPGTARGTKARHRHRAAQSQGRVGHASGADRAWAHHAQPS